MKTFEQRKAEIFCRAQIQREKEKKALARALKIGFSTALCLCISVLAVLYMPDTVMDAPIADAESKGNAGAMNNAANDALGEPNKSEDAGDFDSVCSAEDAEEQVSMPEEINKDDALPEMSETDEGNEGEEGVEVLPETSEPEEECGDEDSIDVDIEVQDPSVSAPSYSYDKLSEIMGGEVVVARVERVYEDYLYDTGFVALVPGECLYGRDEFVKLALPMSYQGMLQTGDVLIVLLDKDSPYDIPLHEDAVYIIGKTENPFEELAALDGFDVEMDTDEVLAFFADFSK